MFSAVGLTGCLLFGAAGAALADTIYKADTATLNTSADWVGGTNASIEHIGRFDSLLSAANAASLSLGADLALGGLYFANNLKGPVSIAAGNTLTLGASGISASSANQTVTFNHDIQLAADQTWRAANKALTLNGDLAGDAGITLIKTGKNDYNNLWSLTASNTFAGTVDIREGHLRLYNTTGSLIWADVIVSTGAEFRVNGTAGIAPAEGLRGKRVTLNGGLLRLTGPGTMPIHETFSGPLRIGPGFSEVLAIPDTSPLKPVWLTFQRMERDPGGVVFLHGSNTGDQPFGVSDGRYANIEFVEPPALVGGGGAYNTPNASIIPYAVSNPYSSDPPYYFATYQSGYGVRQLKTGSYASGILDGSVTTTNARLLTAVTLNQPTTINALIFEGEGGIEGPGTLTLTSGALMSAGNRSVNGIGINTPGTLAFGDAEAILNFRYGTNTLVIGSAVTGSAGLTKGSSGNLTFLGPVDMGGVIDFANGRLTIGDTVNGHIRLSRNGTLNLLPGSAVSGSVTVSGGNVYLTNTCAIAGALTVGEIAAVTMSDGGSVAGGISVLAGSTLTLNSGSIISGSLTNFGTFNYNSTDAAPITITLDGLGTVYQRNTNAPLTLFQSSGEHMVGNISPAVGATVILDGEPDAYTIVTNATLGPANRPFVVNGGIWAYDMQYASSVQADVTVNGGVLTVAPGSRRFAFYNAGGHASLTLNGGLVADRPETSWSVRLGNFDGAWATTGCDFTGVQTGGILLVQCDEYLHLGSFVDNKTATYELSGGTVYAFGRNTANAVSIGSGTNNSLSAFTLTGSGRLVSSGRIYGNRGEASANQVFAFTGGTLATASYDAGNLRPEPGGARGALFNGGGTLAPGDLGTPGRTLVTGGYTSAPNAVIALDIGGTAQASAFTNAPGSYDHLRITGDATVEGELRVSLINGFLPSPASGFYAVSCDNPILFPSGGFANAADNRLWAEDGFTRFGLSYPEGGKHVVLGNAELNQWAGAAGGDWDAEGAWSVTNPAAAEFGAYFGPNLAAAGTVTAETGRTLRGLAFSNAVSYTVAGPGALTLASDGAYGMPRILSLLGSHTLTAALVLQDALTVDVANAAGTLTLAGAVTGGKALTKLGAGTLSLAGGNVLGAVTVSAGTAAQAGGVSEFVALDVAAGGVYRLASGTLTLAEGLTVATGGAFDFARYGGGTLRLARGAAGGAADTVAEFWEAVGDGRVTVKGQAAADPSLFIIKEEESGGVWYVTVTLKSFGTLLQFR